MMEMHYETVNCVQAGCTNKATIWTGHILRGDEPILAGWCDLHRTVADSLPDLAGDKQGYVRDYKHDDRLKLLHIP